MCLLLPSIVPTWCVFITLSLFSRDFYPGVVAGILEQAYAGVFSSRIAFHITPASVWLVGIFFTCAAFGGAIAASVRALTHFVSYHFPPASVWYSRLLYARHERPPLTCV